MPFQKRLVDLQNKPEDFCAIYAQVSPDKQARAKVPILVHGKDVLIESAIICEYVEAAFAGEGTALLPQSALERASIALFSEAFSSLFSTPSQNLLSSLAEGVEKQEAAREELVRGLTALDAFLVRAGTSDVSGDTEAGYFLGSQFSMAEVITGPFLLRRMATLPAIGDFDLKAECKKHKLARLEQWMSAVAARPSLASTIPSKEDLVQSTQRMMARMKELAAASK